VVTAVHDGRDAGIAIAKWLKTPVGPKGPPTQS